MQSNLETIPLIDSVENIGQFVSSFSCLHNCLDTIGLVLDPDNIVLAATDKFNADFAIDNPQQFIGGLLTNKAFPLLKKLKLLLAQLKKNPADDRQRFIYLNIVKDKHDADVSIIHITPVFNTKHEFLCHSMIIRPFRVLRVVSLVVKFRNIANLMPVAPQPKAGIKLTVKQQMVLYLYARGLSYSEVADFLTRVGFPISISRVNEHLKRLKELLEAKNREQLRELALKLNYDIAFPRSFLVNGVYEITNDVFDHWVVS